jgi:anthranilate synthase component II
VILLLDNYDSFTWNLFHYLEQLTDEEIVVKRNDEISVDAAGDFSSFVLSPGPGLPNEAGILKRLIRKYSETKPMLGICLGFQAIAEVYGGLIYNLPNPLHGVSRNVSVCDQSDKMFYGLPQQFSTGHYHSWAVSNQNLPEELTITARDQDGIIMALRHKTKPVHGLQFHPESVMSDFGLDMIGNWLKYCRNQ